VLQSNHDIYIERTKEKKKRYVCIYGERRNFY